MLQCLRGQADIRHCARRGCRGMKAQTRRCGWRPSTLPPIPSDASPVLTDRYFKRKCDKFQCCALQRIRTNVNERASLALSSARVDEETNLSVCSLLRGAARSGRIELPLRCLAALAILTAQRAVPFLPLPQLPPLPPLPNLSATTALTVVTDRVRTDAKLGATRCTRTER